MLQVTEGFIIDETKTSISADKVVFTKGQIIDLLLDLVYVRKGFTLEKQDGALEVYYDPILEQPYLKTTRSDDPKQVYLGRLEVSGSTVSMTYANNASSGGITVISSGQGVVHTETIPVINGKLTLEHKPNVIIEIYVEGYGFMDVDSSILIELNVVDLGTTELDGYDVRIVYES